MYNEISLENSNAIRKLTVKEVKVRIDDILVKQKLDKAKEKFKQSSYCKTIGKCLDLLNEIENMVNKCDGNENDSCDLYQNLYVLFNGEKNEKCKSS